MPALALVALLAAATGTSAVAAEPAVSASSAEEAGPKLTVPAQIDLLRLTQLVAQTAQVPLHFTPAQLQGQVNLSVREPVGPQGLWRLYHQVLHAANMTTVVSESPLVYRVVAVAEAVQVATSLAPERLAALPFEPGYQVRLATLRHAAAEPVQRVLTPIVGSGVVLRPVGAQRLQVAGIQPRLAEVEQWLRLLDVPGAASELRVFTPRRTVPSALQAAVGAAWSAIGRNQGAGREVEVQPAPDGRRLLIIGPGEAAIQVEALAKQLDDAEPVIARTYQPRWFGLDEVAQLIQQTIVDESAAAGAARLRLVVDRLTGSLLVKATAAEHQQIADLIARLDAAPEGARRTARTFLIKHRDVEELATTLAGLVRVGVGDAGEPGAAKPPAPVPASDPRPGAAGERPAPGITPAGGGTPTVQVTARPGSTRRLGDDLVLTTDPHTSRLIAVGEPRRLDMVARLIADLDVRQPQVDLEVILVSMNEATNRDLGVELIARIQNNEVEGTVGSLFGLSSAAAATPLVRTLPAASAGLGGVILRPGDFAGVVKALETVTKGRSLVRARVVTVNNGKADLNSVLQQPFASVNAGQTVSTTSFSGTSDAGTQVSIAPQITAGDHVTLTYQITQSAFVGQPVTSNGTVLPPPKRSDNVTSLATVPNGYVVAMGGIASQSDSEGESRLPLLGSLPLLGALFKSRSDSRSDSRFYVFIKVTVLRHQGFEDLRHLSLRPYTEAGVGSGEPTVAPQLIR